MSCANRETFVWRVGYCWLFSETPLKWRFTGRSRSGNVCLLNTGIDPSPPPQTTTKIQNLSGQHSVLGHHQPASKTPGPPPLNQQSGSAYAIFKHYSKWMLAFISLRVLQKGELMRNVPLYTGLNFCAHPPLQKCCKT